MASEPEGEAAPSWMVNGDSKPEDAEKQAEQHTATEDKVEAQAPNESGGGAAEEEVQKASTAKGPLNPEGIRVLIVTIGNRGDVQPAAALGCACMCMGARAVGIATHPCFQEFVPSELDFFGVGPSLTESLNGTSDGKAVAEAGSFSKSSAMKKFMTPYVDNMIDKLAAAVQSFKPDTIVLFTNAVFVAAPVLEKYPTIASVWVHLLPFAETTEHAPPVGFGDGQVYFSFGASLKWSYAMAAQYELYKTSVDAKRAAWGLEPVENSLYTSEVRTLSIMGYNSALCPRPSDWDKECVHVVGGFMQKFLEAPIDYKPPVELIAPLGLGRDASEARPIVFYFGSALAQLSQSDQRKLLSACVKAGCDVGVGAIIFTKEAASDPFGGRNHALIDDSARGLLLADSKVVLFDGECPHTWLFSRAGALVCHGGIGTIYSALVSKCPVIVSPVNEDSDQAWWGHCLQKQGLGKLIQPAKTHKSGKSIAEGLRAVLSGGSESQSIKAKISAFADSVYGTDPAEDAATLIINETQSAAKAAGKAQFKLYPKEVSLAPKIEEDKSGVVKHFRLKHDAAVYR